MLSFNARALALILGPVSYFLILPLSLGTETHDNWRPECVGLMQINLPGGVEIATNSVAMLEGEYTLRSIQPQFSFSDGQLAEWSHLNYLGGLKVSAPLTAVELGRLSNAAKKKEARARDWSKNKKVNEYGDKLVFESLSVRPFVGSASRVNSSYDVSLFLESTLIRLSFSGQSQELTENKEEFDDFLHGVEPRTVNSVPSVSGICLPYFFIKSDKHYDRNIAVTYRLKSHPDVTVWLEDSTAADYDVNDRDEAIRSKNAEPSRRIDDFWGQYSISRTAKDVGSLWTLPIKRSVKLAGQDGLASFVQITRKDNSIDYGYLAVSRGKPKAKEDTPDLRLYVIREAANAKAKGIEPLAQKDFLDIAEAISASVQKHSMK